MCMGTFIQSPMHCGFEYVSNKAVGLPVERYNMSSKQTENWSFRLISLMNCALSGTNTDNITPHTHLEIQTSLQKFPGFLGEDSSKIIIIISDRSRLHCFYLRCYREHSHRASSTPATAVQEQRPTVVYQYLHFSIKKILKSEILAALGYSVFIKNIRGLKIQDYLHNVNGIPLRNKPSFFYNLATSWYRSTKHPKATINTRIKMWISHIQACWWSQASFVGCCHWFTLMGFHLKSGVCYLHTLHQQGLSYRSRELEKGCICIHILFFKKLKQNYNDNRKADHSDK